MGYGIFGQKITGIQDIKTPPPPNGACSHVHNFIFVDPFTVSVVDPPTPFMFGIHRELKSQLMSVSFPLPFDLFLILWIRPLL